MLKELAVIYVIMVVTSAFPDGPPEDPFCDSMPRVPGHGKESLPDNTCPFMIVALPWIPGRFAQMGILTYQQDDRSKFRGFAATVTLNNDPIGTMKSTDQFNRPRGAKTKTICNNKSLSHANNTLKAEVLFEWRAPADLDPNSKLQLRLTVVGRTRDEQWVDCRLEEMGDYLSLDVTGVIIDPSDTTTAAPDTTESTSATTEGTTEGTTASTTVDTTTPTTVDTTSPTTAETTTATSEPAKTRSTTSQSTTVSESTSTAESTTSERTTRRPDVVPGPDNSDVEIVETYMRYSLNLKHRTISRIECEEGRIRYMTMESTDCTEYQVDFGHPILRYTFKCPLAPGGRQMRFDAQLCTCIPTRNCP